MDRQTKRVAVIDVAPCGILLARLVVTFRVAVEKRLARDIEQALRHVEREVGFGREDHSALSARMASAPMPMMIAVYLAAMRKLEA